MSDKTVSDLLPVCQRLRAAVLADPILARQWRALALDLARLLSAPRTSGGRR
ncbi:MAG: hypothetical protein ACRDXX_03060 [Stackebrandtia sp.]